VIAKHIARFKCQLEDKETRKICHEDEVLCHVYCFPIRGEVMNAKKFWIQCKDLFPVSSVTSENFLNKTLTKLTYYLKKYTIL